MNTGVVSRRFAKALLAYAKGEGLEDKVYKEVKTLAAHFAEVPALRRAVENPVLERSKKLELLCEASGGKDVSQVMTRFLSHQYPPYSLVYYCLLHHASLQYLWQPRITLAGGLHIKACRYGQKSCFCRINSSTMKSMKHIYSSPVSIDISLKPPVFSQDLSQ